MTRNFPACVSRSWTIKRRGRGEGEGEKETREGCIRVSNSETFSQHPETRYRLSADDRSFSRTGKSLSVMPGLFYIRKRCV